MKVRAMLIIPVCSLLFILNCASESQQLKKDYPEIYNDIIGKWYILDSKKIGDIIYTISFNEDGTVSGDVASIFGISDPHWTAELYGGSMRISGSIPTKNGWFICEGYLSIHKADTDNIASDQIIIVYTNNKNEINQIPLENINSTYLNYIPPLSIMKISTSFVSFLGNVKTFVFARDLATVNNFKVQYSDNSSIEKDNWGKINKNSILKHIEFLQNTKDAQLKSEAEESLHKLLDKKIIKFLKINYPIYSNYSNFNICFEDAKTICTFYEFFRIPVLARNPNSGEKIARFIFVKNSYKNGFDIILNIKGFNINGESIEQKTTISFKPFNNKVIVMGIKEDWLYPNGWEIGFSSIAEQMKDYPTYDYIDIESLENI